LPRYGGVFLQAEDEMAALAAAIGASYAGTRAMTATSGPGFSLMTELLSMAGMAEIPVVLVDSQRAGPSTGMPTKTEQSDLNHAIFGGHGDPVRIVVAMATVADCFTQTVRAFDLAERYQMPVVLLTDQSLAHRTETISVPTMPENRGPGRLRPTAEEMKGYRRYRLTDSGVSPMAVPGIDPSPYMSESLEHDEEGHPNYAPVMRARMMSKRLRKLDLVRDELGAVARYGVEDPEIGIISWGSSEGSVHEGIDMAVAEGFSVAAMHPRFMSPLAEGQIVDFIKPLRHLIIAEVNATGQLANLLGSRFPIEPVRLNKCGGWPFHPKEILRSIKEVAARG
jgi:2-oxoglutarate ferredoxin oxidoreductase subunit alpha